MHASRLALRRGSPRAHRQGDRCRHAPKKEAGRTRTRAEGDVGHSKWATIKRKKRRPIRLAASCSRSIFKEITIAARAGGRRSESNPRSRTAISAAKAGGTCPPGTSTRGGPGNGGVRRRLYEDALRGLRSRRVALLVEVATDTAIARPGTSATVHEARGNLAEAGSVSYLFKPRGLIVIDKSAIARTR